MGAAEDRATLAERKRLEAAAQVTEILIPGYGIWTVEGLKKLLDERQAPVRYVHGYQRLSPQMVEEVRKYKEYEREQNEAAGLHDQHPGRWGDHASPQRMRRDLERDREEDRHE